MPYNDSLLALIRERTNYAQLFGEFVELRGTGAERTGRCVFHQDTRPSMSVNVEDGLYLCHNPECGARGDFIQFYRRVRSLSFSEAIAELARRVGLDHALSDSGSAESVRRNDPAFDAELQRREAEALANYQPRYHNRVPTEDPEEVRTVDPVIVDAFHERLLGDQVKLDYLSARRGITRQTVVAFKLGHDGQRYQIPVYDEDLQVVNIRRYKPQARRAQDKMISWREGFGTARLYPIHMLGDGPVYLMEGEMDCLLAQQLGLNALTTTGGAGTWRDAWNEKFRDRDVIICYDNDGAGAAGANTVALQLFPVTRSIRVVRIPLNEPPGADFTDFIVGHGHSIVEFNNLVMQTSFFRREEASAIPPLSEEPLDVHLSQASKAQYYNKPVRFAVMVSGKTTSPYLIPREVRMGCPTDIRGSLDMCLRCPVNEAQGPVSKRLEFENNDLLTFANVTDVQLTRAIKHKVGVPSKCLYARHTVLEAMNVEEVQLIPEVERTEAAAPYVTTAAYYMGHGLEANNGYLMTGVTVPEPKRQLATHLIHTAAKSQSNIDAFRLTADVIDRLAVFRPEGNTVEALWSHLSLIYTDIEKAIRIYQRRDLLLAVDLIFHSVLRFKFQGQSLVRGWTEALVIGDSRTGKSSIVSGLIDYYGAGEFATGENTTLAGLIGGLHQVGTSWALQWGRIPLNDRRLLAIDEAGNLPAEQIARMSSMRSSGVAEVIKVHTERTNARTRQIWISNPRSPRPLSSFSQGVLAVKELIGAPEDIARFDLVVSAASGDVPMAVINAPREQETPMTFTRDLCHQRVMWAWSRQMDHVMWDTGTVDLVLQMATEHGERYRYATEIPLVEPNEQRIKIARLAVAAAAVFFSTDDDAQRVVVKPQHVQFVGEFLEALYAKPSLSFTEYADMQRRRYQITENGGRLQEMMERNPNAARALMESEQFTQRDLQEIFSFGDRDALRESITMLRDAGFLKRSGSSFYQKTPAAIIWLRQHITHGALNGQRNGTPHVVPSATVPARRTIGSEELPDEPQW